MKKLLFVISVLFAFNLANAQDQEEVKTLFSGKVKYSGWFIGMPFTVTQIDKRTTTLTGFEAGITFNRKVSIGFRGNGLSQYYGQLEYTDKFPEKCSLEGGYGGLLIEPVFFHNQAVHFTVPVLIGGGAAALVPENNYRQMMGMNNYDDNNNYNYKHRTLDRSDFFVFEPGINVEVNLFKRLKAAAGVSYRVIGGLDLQNTKADALNGVAGNITIKFGKF